MSERKTLRQSQSIAHAYLSSHQQQNVFVEPLHHGKTEYRENSKTEPKTEPSFNLKPSNELVTSTRSELVTRDGVRSREFT
jgi:hypothetical protein